MHTVASIRRLLRRFGIDLIRYDPAHVVHLRRDRLMRTRGVDVVLDVGANDGPFGRELRAAGYRGRIFSFEPQSQAFASLERVCEDDGLWECRRVALGAATGEAVLNIAANSSSSSLLAMSPLHVESAPESAYVGTERVPLTTLDALCAELLGAGERAYLKIDVQGGELEVLHGAEETLAQCVLVEVELSLASLYEGAPEFDEVIRHLRGREFEVYGLEPVLVHPHDGRLLQIDALLGRALERARRD